MKMYYLSLTPSLWKTFGTRNDAFWCCTGTGAEEFAKFGDTIYSHDGEGIYVNQFIGSEVDWPEKQLKLSQDTNFPEEQGTTLTVNARSSVAMPVQVRVPYWATRGVSVRVNGKVENIAAQPGAYLKLNRKWNDGDRIEVSLPMDLHIDALADDHSLQAMMYGPLVLVGRLGKEGLTKEMIYGPLGPDETKTIPVPEIKAANNSTAWVQKQSGSALDFSTADQATNLSLTPLYKLMDERYTVYWKVKNKEV
jgi:hypothetical protein